MSIKVGDKAPDFSLYSEKKERFTLSEQDAHVLILFYPGAFSSVCTTELNNVNNESDLYEEYSVQVVGISTDSPYVLNEFRKVNKLSFPLLSDHDGEVSALYGAKYNRDFTAMKLDRISRRAAFVVDRTGVVRYAEVLESAGEMPDFDEIKRVVASLASLSNQTA
jgi:glutaredoxin-dependent peroxiredoxin